MTQLIGGFSKGEQQGLLHCFRVLPIKHVIQLPLQLHLLEADLVMLFIFFRLGVYRLEGQERLL